MDELTTVEGSSTVAQNVNRSLVKPAYVVILVGFIIILIPFPGTGILGGLIAGFCGLILGIVNMTRGAVTAGIFQIILGVIGTPIVYGISWLVFVGTFANSG